MGTYVCMYTLQHVSAVQSSHRQGVSDKQKEYKGWESSLYKLWLIWTEETCCSVLEKANVLDMYGYV